MEKIVLSFLQGRNQLEFSRRAKWLQLVLNN